MTTSAGIARARRRGGLLRLGGFEVPRVIEVDSNRFAIVEGDLWWPGRFDSPLTARRAAALREADLARLQAHKNAEARGARGVITVADLEHA
ncbi:hypothetical protein FF100_30395 [Methylobacterium terricola]|uniref:Uncharacterized protein n=1 Tax=Methylobacterium terricola TaxID=2583531 RepID=A0A5C4L8E8_9HYPH|nr:hypothetical protein [Methylobacterium terricola]TNC08040.1 hypothetical protein FF100_30395 [Methylobacterium terricola]